MHNPLQRDIGPGIGETGGLPGRSGSSERRWREARRGRGGRAWCRARPRGGWRESYGVYPTAHWPTSLGRTASAAAKGTCCQRRPSATREARPLKIPAYHFDAIVTSLPQLQRSRGEESAVAYKREGSDKRERGLWCGWVSLTWQRAHATVKSPRYSYRWTKILFSHIDPFQFPK